MSVRSSYDVKTIAEVRARYPLCQSKADREELARDLGFVDQQGRPTLSKLYNLTSVLNLARRPEPERVAVAAEPDLSRQPRPGPRRRPSALAA